MFGRSTHRHRSTNPLTGGNTRSHRRGGLFGRKTHRSSNPLTGDTTSRRGGGFFHRKNPNRRAAGLKGALHNPNTTHSGRKEAKAELREMGLGREAHGHPSFGSRIRNFFGIRSSRSRRVY